MNVTWELILAIAGGIVVIYNAIKALMNAANPITSIKKKVEKHDELLNNDNERLNSIENSNKMLCKSMLALLEHEITGNGIDKLKTTKSELQNFLIEKK